MTTKTCSVENCDQPSKAKGLCAAHYERLRKYGNPTYVPIRQPMSEETKRKIRNTTIGRAKAPGRINGPPSEETRQKISAALKGNTNCDGKQNALGKTWTLSEESRQRQREAHTLRPLNPEPNYQAVHIWMRRHYDKTGFCEVCGEEKLTYWSNISGDYHRLREDFWELCIPCHKVFDYILVIEKADPVKIAVMKAKRLKND